MAKDKKKDQDKTCGVSEKGGKYFCEACQAEVPHDEDCPTCKRHVNWDLVNVQMKKFFQ